MCHLMGKIVRRLLIGDPSKARTILGWTPGVDFPTLITMMVDADLARRYMPLDDLFI